MKKYDLAVIGGGFAGVAAALAAARGGADVIIIEKSNALGGAANICLVNPFMPYKTKIDGKEVALSAGIFREIHQKLEARGAMRGETFLEVVGGDFGASSVGALPLILGFLSAFLSGLFACKVMIALVKKAKLSWFALYCLVASACIFIFA